MSPIGRWCLSIVFIAAIVGALYWQKEPSTAELLEQAVAAELRGDFEDAGQLCVRVLEIQSDSIPALTIASNAALQTGRAAQTEAAYRRILEIDPRHSFATVKLAYLLGVEGRCSEAAPLLFASVRRGEFSLHHLVLLAASEPVISDPALIERFRKAVPQDSRPLLGIARTLFQKNETKHAEAILRQVIEAAPEMIEAHTMLGRVLVAARPEGLDDWQCSLPASAERHAEIWSVRGAWCELLGESRGAIRCYAEAMRCDPNQRVASFRLGQLLTSIGELELAHPFVERADQLRELMLLVDQIYTEPDSEALIRRASEITESLGRLWEARSWAVIAMQRIPHAKWAVETVQRLAPRLLIESPQTVSSSNVAATIDWSRFKLPTIVMNKSKTTRDRSTANSVARSNKVCNVRFEDVATASGLDFIYRNRLGESGTELRLLETTGGGVAVLDYDLNGFPDLYFTQGTPLPPTSVSTMLVDSLFRNLGDGHFQHAAQHAGVDEHDYGQGATVGDFDNDGFPDLYVANFGINRLYRNQGDGTFEDVTEATGLTGSRWTTSCTMADLNGDSLPDLYDVNYLSGEAAATQICRRGAEVRWCSPDVFEAEQDQVYLNLGDGRFQNVTTTAGIVVPNGKGLGIVAADFDGSGRLSLFIANDAVANFFFVNQSSKSGSAIQFIEQAVPYGLAFDRDGLPQACMGIAAGDANGDGRLDLFVTNFADQSNTLYQQLQSGLFEDDTRRAGLRDPSFAMLGFGTQFLDGELDGHQDLVLTNGHVYDLSYKSLPYEMRPQYYHNFGSGRFAEVDDKTLGACFARKALGRGLARLDWNRDGLEDVVISNMNSPAALLENRTSEHGHFLTLHLRGVESSRDAIGTTVEVVTHERIYVRQLTAGDGYQSSNERQLTIGIGAATQIQELRVRWPSGLKQSWNSLAVDRALILIEGSHLF